MFASSKIQVLHVCIAYFYVCIMEAPNSVNEVCDSSICNIWPTNGSDYEGNIRLRH